LSVDQQERTRDVSTPAATRSPFVYTASLAIDVKTTKRIPEADTIANETRIVLERIAERLKPRGCTLRDIVKTTCYLSDEKYRMEFIEAYREAFAPGPYPARCTLVLGLAGDCRVQVDVIAVAPDAD
jgi:2-iminobutanoate/2-iminopropanoate deaminase